MDNQAPNSADLMAIGALQISATAKYIGTVMAATGVTAANELTAITGLPRSTVYRAQAEFFTGGGCSLIRLTCPTSEIPTRPTDETTIEKPVSVVPPVRQIPIDASPAPASITTRATNELPTEVNSYEDNITPLLPPSLKTPSAKTKRGARLSDDWELPEDWRQWALVNCPAASLEMVNREALKFANHWQSQPGAKACKLDWRKTFQNWCLTAFSRAPLRPSQGYQPAASSGATWHEERRRKTQIILALARGETVANG